MLKSEHFYVPSDLETWPVTFTLNDDLHVVILQQYNESQGHSLIMSMTINVNVLCTNRQTDTTRQTNHLIQAVNNI